MPVERSKRSDPHGVQLQWTGLSSTTTTFEFAPNVTPTSYSEPPPLVEIPDPESCVFPPHEDEILLQPCTKSYGKKRRASYIPRPPNAFILFRSSFIKNHHVSTSVEKNHSTLSKIIGLTWSGLSPAERDVWYGRAKLALIEHRKKWPEYSFRPSNAAKAASQIDGGYNAKANAKIKRRPREAPSDQKRCRKIAQLLVDGLKGEELDAAIEEFDQTHVNEPLSTTIEFEEPVTVNRYRRRRSSSVPGNGLISTRSQMAPPRSNSCGLPDAQGIVLEEPITFDASYSLSAISQNELLAWTQFHQPTPRSYADIQSPLDPLASAPSALPPLDTSPPTFSYTNVTPYSFSPATNPPSEFSSYSSREPSPPVSPLDVAPLAINTTFARDPQLWSSPVSPEYFSPAAQTSLQPQVFMPSYEDPMSFDFSTCAEVTFDLPPALTVSQRIDYSQYAAGKESICHSRLPYIFSGSPETQLSGSGNHNMNTFGYMPHVSRSQPLVFQ